MMQRVYGLAFANKKELRSYVAAREEAMKRDHRRVGAELDLFAGAPETAFEHLAMALEGIEALVAQDPTNLKFRVDRAGVWRLDAEYWLAAGDPDRARERLDVLSAEFESVLDRSDATSVRFESALSDELLGRLEAAQDDASAAATAWRRALETLPPPDRCNLSEAALRAVLLRHLGRGGEAAELNARLAAAGFRDLAFTRPKNS